MIERLKEALRSGGAASDWRISETVKRGVEWFLAGRVLDTARSVDTSSYSVMVCVDRGEGEAKTRGAYSVTIHPSADDAAIR